MRRQPSGVAGRCAGNTRLAFDLLGFFLYSCEFSVSAFRADGLQAAQESRLVQELTFFYRGPTMYAVVKTGGKQYKVAAGEKLKVEQIPVSYTHLTLPTKA